MGKTIVFIVGLLLLIPFIIFTSIKSIQCEIRRRRRYYQTEDDITPLSPNAYVLPETTPAELEADDGVQDEVSEQKSRSIRALKGFVGASVKIASICQIYMEYRRKEASFPSETALTERKICIIRMKLIENETVMRSSNFGGAKKTARATVLKLRKELAALKEQKAKAGLAEKSPQVSSAGSAGDNAADAVSVEERPSAPVFSAGEPRFLQKNELLGAEVSADSADAAEGEMPSGQHTAPSTVLPVTETKKPPAGFPKDDFYVHKGNYNESGETDEELKKRRGF